MLHQATARAVPAEQRRSQRQAINDDARSWVMTSPNTNPPFTPLAGEKLIHTTPKRVQLSIETSKHYPGKQEKPFSLANASGQVFLTNARVIYLPEKPTAEFKNFACPILNLHDSHVHMPWFGANGWQALVQPVSGGGMPTPSTGVLELHLKFHDNGAIDFHEHYMRMRERLQQAIETQRANGEASATRSAINGGVDVSTVPLEDLPAYAEESDGPLIAPTAAGIAPSPVLQQQTHRGGEDAGGDGSWQQGAALASGGSSTAFNPPDEPPPGYEEAQMATLHDEAEWAAESTRRP